MEKILPIIIIVLFLLNIVFVISRYRRCPADKLMVIYGKVGNDKNGNSREYVCIHGGAAFVWPIIQSYQYLDLNLIKIDMHLKNILSKNKVLVNIEANLAVGISTDAKIRDNAVKHLLGLSHEEIHDVTKNLLNETVSKLINRKDADYINSNSNEFMLECMNKVTDELNELGIALINYHLTRISLNETVTDDQD